MAAAHATGRPILIGTLDVAESERLAGELGRAGMRCTVLNAKNDAEEAAIVAEAGAYGAITVSTQRHRHPPRWHRWRAEPDS